MNENMVTVLTKFVTVQTKAVGGPSLCLIGPWSRQGQIVPSQDHTMVKNFEVSVHTEI
jgi:hypothetical protein